MGWLDNPLGALNDKIREGTGVDVGGAIDDARKNVEGVIDGGRKAVEEKVEQGKNAAGRAVNGAISTVTGEEATPPELASSQVNEVQAALGLQQGKVGPRTKAGVEAFLKQHPELGLELNDVIKGDKMIGDPKFLGAIEKYTGQDLGFFTPTPSVQEQLQKGYDAAAAAVGGAVQTGRDAIDNAISGAKGFIQKAQEHDCVSNGGTFDPEHGCTGAKPRSQRQERQD